jgi:hypothetical protein
MSNRNGRKWVIFIRITITKPSTREEKVYNISLIIPTKLLPTTIILNDRPMEYTKE